jgi:ATP-dependent Clp protease protease subunit
MTRPPTRPRAEIVPTVIGQPVDRVKQDTERDNFMSAPEARAYGLIDQVLASARPAG